MLKHLGCCFQEMSCQFLATFKIATLWAYHYEVGGCETRLSDSQMRPILKESFSPCKLLLHGDTQKEHAKHTSAKVKKALPRFFRSVATALVKQLFSTVACSGSSVCPQWTAPALPARRRCKSLQDSSQRLTSFSQDCSAWVLLWF